MNGSLTRLLASIKVARANKGIELTSQRLPSRSRLLRSGARVGKSTEFGGSLCVLVLDVVRDGAIGQCVFHALCSRMVLDCIGRRLST